MMASKASSSSSGSSSSSSSSSSESSTASSDVAPAIAPPLGICTDDFFQKCGYLQGQPLGKGMSCEVVLAYSKDLQHRRALKKLCLHGDEASNKQQRQQDRALKRLFANEVGILKKLHHRHVMSLFMAVSCPRYLGIVVPYCSKGSLDKHINSLDLVTLDKYFVHMTEALYYLYQLKIVHGDIKPRNVLIDSNNNAVLCDFGLARQMPDYDTKVVFTCGTRPYRAPETLTIVQQEVDPFKCDMFALGATLWSMLLKRNPNQYTNYLKVLSSFSILFPQTFMDRAEGLLEVEPDKRWSIQTLQYTLKETAD